MFPSYYLFTQQITVTSLRFRLILLESMSHTHSHSCITTLLPIHIVLDELFDQCHVSISSSSMEDNFIQVKFDCGVNLAIMWIC